MARFLSQLARGAEFRSPSSGLANPAGWLTDALSTTASYSGKPVTVTNAFGLSPVYAAVSIIAETIGMLPLKVYRDLGEGEKVEARTHRSWRFLHDQPNPITPAHNFWSTVTTHLLLWGNAFLRKERSDESGLVDTLWILPPWEMTVESDGRTKSFAHQPSSTGKPQPYSDEDIVHLMGLSTNGLMGESPITRCRQSFGTTMAREEFEGGFYKRGALLRGVIEHPNRISRAGTANDNPIEKLRNQWEAVYGGSENMGKTAVLEEGATFKPLSMPLRDLEFVSSQQLSRTDIATLFRIPPSYLGGSTGDSLTYATVEANQTQFAQLAVVPWTNVIAKSLAADAGIFPQGVFYPEFVVEGLLRADSKSRAEYWRTMKEIGAVDADYIAARENFPPPKPKPQVVLPPDMNGDGDVPPVVDLLADKQE